MVGLPRSRTGLHLGVRLLCLLPGAQAARLLTGARRTSEVERTSRHVLMYITLPASMIVGLADYLCHRSAHVERNAGAHESLIHTLMLAEASVPSLLGMFAEVNAGVLVLALGASLAHEATAIWDVAYAEPRRRVGQTEQHVHSFLEALPFVTTSFLAVQHWEQARALVGVGGEKPRFGLRFKSPPVSPRVTLGILAGFSLFGVLPYAEEFWRCFRYNRTLTPYPEPELPQTPTLRIDNENGVGAHALERR